MWDDSLVFLIAILLFTTLLLDKIYNLIELPFDWFIDDPMFVCLLDDLILGFLLQQFDTGNRWIWTRIEDHLRPFEYKNREKKGTDKSFVQPKTTADPLEILATYQYFNYFLTDKMLEENAFETNQYHIQSHGEALKPQFFEQELEVIGCFSVWVLFKCRTKDPTGRT